MTVGRRRPHDFAVLPAFGAGHWIVSEHFPNQARPAATAAFYGDCGHVGVDRHTTEAQTFAHLRGGRAVVAELMSTSVGNVQGQDSDEFDGIDLDGVGVAANVLFVGAYLTVPVAAL